MSSQFGRGFITNIMLISKHAGLPPQRAWIGLADHLNEAVLPPSFKGTEIEELFSLLRQKIMWHQNGLMDEEDLEGVRKTLRRLVVAIDKELGIENADAGKYD
ncbi:hypothetical protein L1994_07850 [Methanomicrobium antiquum]|uniref:Uncharacterized protein n=1 Tax=Methanomicrobium antiquum TaxID=487686 RepID=A0AAF0FLF7_9EURY|nr:hypothetical protein [Methanomicrobium antiquum]MDD3976834.1 hypothetical protein [Methanomicrobium sp.]WFN36060.1 hypothetical protein L1994_07850 [Methanomicrobium antiquum]